MQKKKKPKQLEEIVVTTTRTEKEMETAPGSVSVVTKDNIEKRNIKSVDEALNTTPGVFNQRTKGILDSIAYVALRGYSRVLQDIVHGGWHNPD